jgi:hypothetical protein
MYVDYGARRRRQTIYGKCLSSSSRVKLRGDLPSIEGAMKSIMAAMNVTEQVSIDVVEVQRLQTIIQGVEIRIFSWITLIIETIPDLTKNLRNPGFLVADLKVLAHMK